MQKTDGENNVADILTKNVKVGVLDKTHGGDETQQGRHSAARKVSTAIEKQISAVSGVGERRTPDAAAAEGAAAMARSVLEADPSPEEYETFSAESTASRAENTKEVEDVKDTRSLARHPLALLAHGCNLLQADAVSEPFYLQAREKPRTVRRSLAQTEHEVRPLILRTTSRRHVWLPRWSRASAAARAGTQCGACSVHWRGFEPLPGIC